MADRYDLDRDRDRDRDRERERERDWERHRQTRNQNEHWGRGSGNWAGEERHQDWGRSGERERGREEWRPERTDEYSGRGDWGNQGAWGRFGNRSDWRHDRDWENRGDWERGRSDWEGRGQFSDDFERRNDWERGRGDWNRDWNRGESGRSRQLTGSEAVGAWGTIGGFGGGATSYGGGMGSYSGQGRFAGRGPKNWQRSDERIREDINERLTDHPHVDATEIDVQVKGGVATLTGTVDDRNAKRLAEDIAENVSGVREVQNQIRVQAASHTGVAHTGGTTITGKEVR